MSWKEKGFDEDASEYLGRYSYVCVDGIFWNVYIAAEHGQGHAVTSLVNWIEGRVEVAHCIQHTAETLHRGFQLV